MSMGNLRVDGVLQLEESNDYAGEKGTIRWTGSNLSVKVTEGDAADSWKHLTVDSVGTIEGIIKKNEDTNSIGIGITEQTPQSKLHLRGPVLIDNTENPAEKSILSMQGNLGIGTFDYATDTHQIESNLQINATYHQAITGTVSGTNNDYNKPLTGTVSGNEDSYQLTGTNTSFVSDLVIGQKIQVGSSNESIYTVKEIDDDNSNLHSRTIY